MWHASVAWVDRNVGRCAPVYLASPATLRAMADLAKELLAGVGCIPSTLERGGMCLHYRRSINESELAQLSQEWCAIPAVDAGGENEVLERDT